MVYASERVAASDLGSKLHVSERVAALELSLFFLSCIPRGNSIRVGQWVERKDGTWVLRIKREDFTDDGKDWTAQSMGQRGGKAHARALSAKKRKEIAKAAADARWKR